MAEVVLLGRGQSFDVVELWDEGVPGVPPRLLGALVLGDLVRLERSSGEAVDLLLRRAIVVLAPPLELLPLPDQPPPELVALLASAPRARGALAWRRRRIHGGQLLRLELEQPHAKARLEELAPGDAPGRHGR